MIKVPFRGGADVIGRGRDWPPPRHCHLQRPTGRSVGRSSAQALFHLPPAGGRGEGPPVRPFEEGGQVASRRAPDVGRGRPGGPPPRNIRNRLLYAEGCIYLYGSEGDSARPYPAAYCYGVLILGHAGAGEHADVASRAGHVSPPGAPPARGQVSTAGGELLIAPTGGRRASY
eukprot:1176543-Prorocentrum_minimum.AAC.3